LIRNNLTLAKVLAKLLATVLARIKATGALRWNGAPSGYFAAPIWLFADANPVARNCDLRFAELRKCDFRRFGFWISDF
jgi:hypothetical protein